MRKKDRNANDKGEKQHRSLEIITVLQKIVIKVMALWDR